MIFKSSMPALAAVSCLALGACTTMGTGEGSTVSGNQSAAFAWQSKDGGVTGSMSAKVGDRTFTGPYLELTSTSMDQSFAPMWMGWPYRWDDWAYGFDDTVTNYSGKVVANLQGPDSQRMRCRFQLNDPRSGMSGGGQGKCQVAGGDTIDATFPHG